jgi:ariadne-1
VYEDDDDYSLGELGMGNINNQLGSHFFFFLSDPLRINTEEDDRYLDDAKDEKPVKKAYEVDYKVHSAEQIRGAQQQQVEEVASILGLPGEQCAILLRYFKWQKDRLIEKYMDSPEDVLDAAGLGPGYDTPSRLEMVMGFSCDICCDDQRGLETYAMKCGHRYCASCYSQYIESKIKDEGEASRIQCPADGCSRIVGSKSVDLLVPSETCQRCAILLLVPVPVLSNFGV